MEYNEKELKFYNERKDFGSFGNKIYKEETELSKEEKLAFIDKYYVDNRDRTGLGTYLYNLFEKYAKEKSSLPQDSWGYVKTVSLKAWLRKNDVKNIVRRDYHYGSYYFLGREYSTMSLNANPLWTSGVPYGRDSDIVNLWFHDLLDKLADNEEKYFKDHNDDNIKVRKIVEYGRRYGSFGIEKIGMVVGNGESVLDKGWRQSFNEPEITSDELGKMLKLYEEFDKSYKLFSEKVSFETGWEKDTN